jgi:acetyl esterase/lipase
MGRKIHHTAQTTCSKHFPARESIFGIPTLLGSLDFLSSNAFRRVRTTLYSVPMSMIMAVNAPATSYVGMTSAPLLWIAFFVGSKYISKFIMYSFRVWLSHLMYWYSYYFLTSSQNASDGVRCLDGVRISRNHRYSDDNYHETLDMLEPTKTAYVGDILYIHGGGFVSVHREVMLQSVTVFARNGYRVFAIDYPLAPEAKHPTAVLSILKAMKHIKDSFAVNTLMIIGDSAGGCLATNTIAAVLNRNFGLHWNFHLIPRLEKLVLLYPILDDYTWRKGNWVETNCYLKRFAQKRVAELLHFSISQYRKHPSDMITICEQIDAGLVTQFIPTFVVCGDLDPLKYSVLRFQRTMANSIPHVPVSAMNFIPHMIHGFHGAPRSMVWKGWKDSMVEVNRAILCFLGGNKVDHQIPPDCKDAMDYVLLIFLCLQIYLLTKALTILAQFINSILPAFL